MGQVADERLEIVRPIGGLDEAAVMAVWSEDEQVPFPDPEILTRRRTPEYTAHGPYRSRTSSERPTNLTTANRYRNKPWEIFEMLVASSFLGTPRVG